jgi:hypothetical protein
MERREKGREGGREGGALERQDETVKQERQT